MAHFVPFSRDQAFLLPPDAEDRLPPDDVARFVAAALDRMTLDAFEARAVPGGEARHRPRPLPALLLHRCANAIFSSRRIERAAHRDPRRRA